MSQRFISVGPGWIKGLTWALPQELSMGEVTLRVLVNGESVLLEVIPIGVGMGYDILPKGSRIAIALGDDIACRVETTSDFEMAVPDKSVTADVILEYV